MNQNLHSVITDKANGMFGIGNLYNSAVKRCVDGFGGWLDSAALSQYSFRENAVIDFGKGDGTARDWCINCAWNSLNTKSRGVLGRFEKIF